MLDAGTKPTSASSVLTGLAKDIYDEQKSNGIAKGETALTVTIGLETFTEKESERANRVKGEKLNAWCIASAIVKHIKNNAQIQTLTTPVLIESYIAGVGTNGGTLAAGSYPVVGTVNATPSTVIGKVI